MTLFEPSVELLRMLFEYHRPRRKAIKARTFENVDLPTIQRRNRIGYTFRHVLVEFGIQMSLLPIRLCSIVEQGKPGFTVKLDHILRKYIKIGTDRASDKIVEKFAEEFKNWLRNMEDGLSGEFDEKPDWPYKRIYLLDSGTVIMVMNPRARIYARVH